MRSAAWYQYRPTEPRRQADVTYHSVIVDTDVDTDILPPSIQPVLTRASPSGYDRFIEECSSDQSFPTEVAARRPCQAGTTASVNLTQLERRRILCCFSVQGRRDYGALASDGVRSDSTTVSRESQRQRIGRVTSRRRCDTMSLGQNLCSGRVRHGLVGGPSRVEELLQPRRTGRFDGSGGAWSLVPLSLVRHSRRRVVARNEGGPGCAW